MSRKAVFFSVCIIITMGLIVMSVVPAGAVDERPKWIDGANRRIENALAKQYGETQREDIRRGLRQVSNLWRDGDGDEASYESFVSKNYAGEASARDETFVRFENLLEMLDGDPDTPVKVAPPPS